MPHCYDCNTTENVALVARGRPYCLYCYSYQLLSCHACDTFIRWDNRIEVDGVTYCINCHRDLFVFCHNCGTSVPNGQITMHNGHSYCADCLRTSPLTCPSITPLRCEQCNRIGPPSEIRSSYFGNYCNSCYEEQFISCSRCDNECRIDETFEVGNEFICNCCESEMSDWDFSEFNPTTNSYTELDSQLTYGIEIETSTCKGFSVLIGKTIWGCTNDFSISGKEFISPPLYGDKGLHVIRDFCAVAEEKNWTVDSHCGLHIHLGVEQL